MKIFLPAIFTFATALSAHADQCPTSNGYIETNVGASAKTSFLHTTEHHWKFEFWRGAVCWGRPDDQSQDDQNFNQNSNQCNGSIAFTTHRDNQLNYTPMALSWGANLTDGDTFSIVLDDKRTHAVYQESDSECTTNRWGTKLENAMATYETKAVLNVPEDVWVVQIRAKADVSAGSAVTDLQPRIGRQNLKDPANPTGFLQSLTNHEWTYLYVEPGEPLEIAISYANQGLDGEKKYSLRYDFKFIGSNRCFEALGDPSRMSFDSKTLENIIGKAVNNEEDYNDYAVKLGCMRNPVFLKAAMNNSRPDALIPALNAINDRTESLLKPNQDRAARAYSAPYIYTILQMTLVDLSRFALTDLLSYCQSYKDFTRETAVNGGKTEVAGVEAMMLTYSHLEMIYSELARNSLTTLVSNVENWETKNISYAQLFDGNLDTQTALRAYQTAMVQMGLKIYSTMRTEVDARVPQAEIGKTYLTQLLKNLDSASILADAVNVSIRQMLRNFGARSNSKVSVAQLSGNVKQLSDLDAKIHDEMHEYFKWFISADKNGDNGDQFVQTMATMLTDILRPSATFLSKFADDPDNHLPSLKDKFVRQAEIGKLGDQVNQCFFHPYGGAQ